MKIKQKHGKLIWMKVMIYLTKQRQRWIGRRNNHEFFWNPSIWAPWLWAIIDILMWILNTRNKSPKLIPNFVWQIQRNLSQFCIVARGHLEESSLKCLKIIEDQHIQWRGVWKFYVAKWPNLGIIKGNRWTCHLKCSQKVAKCHWWYVMHPTQST